MSNLRWSPTSSAKWYFWMAPSIGKPPRMNCTGRDGGLGSRWISIAHAPSLSVCSFPISPFEHRSGHHRQRAPVGDIGLRSVVLLAMGFRRHKQVRRSFCRAPLSSSHSYIWGRSARALEASPNSARRRGKCRSSAHLFHVPLASDAYTLTDFPSHRSNSSGDESSNIYLGVST
jgi:hypothetical protein